jgi:hypothetical protein
MFRPIHWPSSVWHLTYQETIQSVWCTLDGGGGDDISQSHSLIWCKWFQPLLNIRSQQSKYIFPVCSRLPLKCDGTHAETRFHLSAKRMSPFKLAGASVQSTTGSRGVRISGSNGRYTMFRGSVWVLATHSIHQFPLHFPSHASPCAIIFQLDSTQYLETTEQPLLETRHFGLQPWPVAMTYFEFVYMEYWIHCCNW